MTNGRAVNTHGFTLIEVLAVLAVIFVLVAVLAPRRRTVTKSDRTRCVNNLKNIGLAHRLFATDHGARFPQSLSETNGGSREWLMDAGQLWRHYRIFSNLLSTPKGLVCPRDWQRQPATTFASYSTGSSEVLFTSNTNLSYFLGLEGTEDEPTSILAGDRNLTTNGIPLGPGRHLIERGVLIGYTEQLHLEGGNILCGDGSVQQVASGGMSNVLHDALTNFPLPANTWIVP